MWDMNSAVVVLFSLVAITACQGGVDDLIAQWLQNDYLSNTKTTTELNLDPSFNENNTVQSVPRNEEIEANVIRCTTENLQDGICVKYYLCDKESKNVIEDGYTIIDIREGNACPGHFDVCCLSSQIIENKNMTSTIPAATTSAATVEDKPVQQNPLAQPSLGTLGAQFKCGQSNPGVNVFRVRDGGNPDDRIYADYGEFPWMVAILKRSQDENEWKQDNYIGGGSLIHLSVVLTVAHKLTEKKAEDIKVRAGEWETNSEDEEYIHQERDVAKIVVHQKYFRQSLYNDAGLLFLRKPINLDNAPHIGVGCLAQHMPKPGTICFSMGWGAENFKNKKIFAARLKKVKLSLVSSAKCEELLRATRLGQFFKLHQSLTCAGGKAGVDTCRGDGGSSLVCPINDSNTRFTIVGMVAYGLKCGDANVPGVYVNVPDMYGWVTEQMANEGLDSSSFTYY